MMRMVVFMVAALFAVAAARTGRQLLDTCGLTPTPDNGATGVTAVHYTPDGLGKCGRTIVGANDVCAVSAAIFSTSICGQCIEVTFGTTKRICRVLDECRECPTSKLDLTDATFATFPNPTSPGTLEGVSWKTVACPFALVAPKAALKDGSSRYWIAIQMINLMYPIISLQTTAPGWVFVDSSSISGYWVFSNSAGGTIPQDWTATQKNGEVIAIHAAIPTPPGDQHTATRVEYTATVAGLRPCTTPAPDGTINFQPNRDILRLLACNNCQACVDCLNNPNKPVYVNCYQLQACATPPPSG